MASGGIIEKRLEKAEGSEHDVEAGEARVANNINEAGEVNEAKLLWKLDLTLLPRLALLYLLSFLDRSNGEN